MVYAQRYTPTQIVLAIGRLDLAWSEERGRFVRRDQGTVYLTREAAGRARLRLEFRRPDATTKIRLREVGLN